MVDYENFVAATILLTKHIIPYGKLEFFAPPWAMYFFFPFTILPSTVSVVFWQLGSLAAVATCALLSLPKNRLYPILTLILPPTLLMLVVGQLSAFIAIACTILLLELSGRNRLWVILLCFFVASLKPNIAFVPLLIASITLIRNRYYLKLLSVFLFSLVMLISFELAFPSITKEWISAMMSGSYTQGEQAPLDVTLSNGFTFSIGLSFFRSAPLLISIPLCVWFIYLYYQESLTPRTIALSLSIGFLLIPYYRLYDLVMLYYPIGISLAMFHNRTLNLNTPL